MGNALKKKKKTEESDAQRASTFNKAGGASDDNEVQVMNDRENGDVKDDGKEENAEEAYSYWDRGKTFKPNKKLANSKQQRLHKTIKATMKATLGGGELRKTVQLPDGEDLNEWIAVNSVHFYNAANMIYGTCTEFCTEESCPVMSAGPKYEYLWKDGVKYKKPTKVSAPIYIDNLLNWVNEQISDPNLFPVDESAKFPKHFMSQVKVIYKRLFRLYAHIYYSHIDKIRAIGANAHLNTCFKHFVFFILEFNLVDQEELAPLRKLISKFTKE
jgi:MOB kinase activator 1